MDKDKEYVVKMAKENDVKFIRLWFTDVLGFLKVLQSPSTNWKCSRRNGI